MRNWKVNFILILIFLFGFGIIARLADIQIVKHGYYKAMAQGQQKVFQSTKGERGRIFFTGGQILAANVKDRYVYLSPFEIKEKDQTAEALSHILGMEKDEILGRMDNPESLFEKIKTGLTDDQYNVLKEKQLPGVHLGEDIVREYPQQFMASHIVGFLGGEERGQYGIEGYYDDKLQGRESFNQGDSGLGRHFFEVDKEFNKGSDIFLTIDYNIQFMAEKLLEKAKDNLNIESGQIIVAEPNTGKIMALASYPNFDPNNYSEIEDFDVFQDSSIQKLFEPGSVFKPITMAGALDQGKVTPETSYYDTGMEEIGAYTIYNYGQRSYGHSTMTEVLEKSINTGAIFAGRQLGDEKLLEYLTRFGFFKPTGIDLAGEIFSENRELKKGYRTNYVTASYGQGIEITPIQLVRAFCAIANGGKLVRPYLAEKIVQNDQIIEPRPKVEKGQVISDRTVNSLTAMLVSVVENGFSKSAQVPGYYVAGKTGTALISLSSLNLGETGYSEKTWQSFIGFAPAFDAKFVILVKLDDPATKTAEYSAIPIFQELAIYIVNYLQIPPDPDYE